jgi:hypothetical protein
MIIIVPLQTLANPNIIVLSAKVTVIFGISKGMPENKTANGIF